MISGSGGFTYELYTDVGRSTVLSAANAILYTGIGLAVTTQTAYGRITGAQLAAAKKGFYTDTVAMTVIHPSLMAMGRVRRHPVVFLGLAIVIGLVSLVSSAQVSISPVVIEIDTPRRVVAI